MSRDVLRSLARGLTWPVRRFLDPRLAGVEAAILERLAGMREEWLRVNHETSLLQRQIAETTEETRRLVEAELDASREATAIIGSSLAEVIARLERLAEEVDRLRDADTRWQRPGPKRAHAGPD